MIPTNQSHIMFPPHLVRLFTVPDSFLRRIFEPGKIFQASLILRLIVGVESASEYRILTSNSHLECIVPDAHLANAIETAPFDFLFIQFYNTAQCSARAYFDHSYGGTNTNISFDSWVEFVDGHSYNPNTKVYLGLPAAPDANVVYDTKMYLQPSEAQEIIEALQCEYKHEFGGVMIYEATSSQNNQINGQPYVVSSLLN